MSSYKYNKFILNIFAIILVFNNIVIVSGDNFGLNVNYKVTWGNDHLQLLNQGKEVHLSMDSYSGAGFESRLKYGSGFFHMRIKLPNNKNTAGVVTAFYLTSNTNNHDELDFEFLGNGQGKPATLQTNVFANGAGNREQRIHLWFDPAADFHNYLILWNPSHVVFLVDDTPIRVFKNNANLGVAYPSQPMQVQVSLWNADWASDTKIDWSNGPFVAQFQDFAIGGCALRTAKDMANCYSNGFWWNQGKYQKLNHNQQKMYENVRKKYMYYDYCDDRQKYPNIQPECASNRNGL